MAHNAIQTRQDIYEQIRDSLTGKITGLTNFTDRSFNYVWTQAFSQEIKELQELALISELAGFIEYSGGPLTEDDLEDLGVADEITVERANELMKDEYLDEYVKIVGVSRDQGNKATGTVTFSTQSDSTTIPSGTRVTTEPDSTGNTIDFETTANADTSSGETQATDVPIEAVEVGEEYNVSSNEITRIVNPPNGVTGVNNPTSTTGGEGVETNDELRERAKNAVGGASEGGTAEGIKSYIKNNIDAVDEGDVIIDEFTDPCPPFVDVIVDGGSDVEVTDAIEFSRPTGIEHNLVRPEVIEIGGDINLLGVDIDTGSVTDDVTDFLLGLGIGENLYSDQLIRQVMLSDDDIVNIDKLDLNIEAVTNETYTYSTTIDSAIADDGGSTTEQTADANDDSPDDLTLLPASPSTGDAYYFGSDNIFSQIDINISTAGAGTWDIVWEYYDGAAWSSLSNVTDGTTDFQTGGTNTVSWDIPSDWTSNEVINNDPNYYVRARLDSFSSLSTQPLGEQIFVTGSGYNLDYTFEDENGTISIDDKSGDSYSNNTDFVVVDRSGDGWKDTIVWDNGATPDQSEDFFVDYDVTVLGQTKPDNKHGVEIVRDEAFTFNLGHEDTFDYNNTNKTYELTYIPFDNTVSITDENNTTFTKDTDYQLAPLQDYATEETFTYSTGTSKYALSEDYDFGDVAIIDADGNIYVEGTDYDVIDDNGDGFDDTIDWSIGGGNPSDTVDFTVNYNAQSDTVRWDQNESTPPQDDQFTVTYDQAYYETEYEIVESDAEFIRGSDSSTYQEGTSYDLIDEDRDDEDDGIFWNTNPSSLTDGEEFFLTYTNEADQNFTVREKADPGTINVTVE